jgi:peptidoglycan-associated lipoprotein
MKSWINVLLVCIIGLSVAACAGPKRGGEAATEGAEGQAPTQQQPQAGDERYGLEGGGGVASESLDDPNSILAKRTVYFDFDSSEVKPEDREIVLAHASYLAAHPDANVVLEGHADERGSREYNMGLGERRAKAVRQLMLLQGVSAKQVDFVSFGEERPVALGHDESAWRLNRRVEITYVDQ